jgi:hypothetical protein
MGFRVRAAHDFHTLRVGDIAVELALAVAGFR